jgi:hypothetical protein
LLGTTWCLEQCLGLLQMWAENFWLFIWCLNLTFMLLEKVTRIGLSVFSQHWYLMFCFLVWRMDNYYCYLVLISSMMLVYLNGLNWPVLFSQCSWSSRSRPSILSTKLEQCGTTCSDGTDAFEVVGHAQLSFLYLGVVCVCEVCSCLAASWLSGVVDVSVTFDCVVSNSQWLNNNPPLSLCGSSVVYLAAQV